MQCVYEIKLDMIMATSITAMISSVLIGVCANLPLGMAPGYVTKLFFYLTIIAY
jgi:AGZA family xanthine/uracil permease-like MFS transporter